MHIFLTARASKFAQEKKGFEIFSLLIKSTLFARVVFNEVVDDGKIFIAQSFRHHHAVDVM